jgi:anti-anti-sigma factor
MPNASHGRADSFRDVGAFRLSSHRDGDAHVIALAGELDRWTIAGLERELERVERTDARFIVLDLRELAFIACSGLQVIVMAHRRQAGRLIVVKGPQHVHRVFEICCLAGCCSPSKAPRTDRMRPVV